jgi:2-dehydro-3-deoxygluconokinase
VLHVTGVSLAISETMRATVFEAARRARAAGVLVSLDLNIRPRLWPLETARAVIEGLLPLADIVLPSDDEVTMLYGAMSEGDAVAHFTRHGARIVILKRGAQGALMSVGGGAPILIPAPKVRAIDSTGAGDSFAGGFLAAYLETSDAEAAAHRAAAIAAETVTGWGGTDAIPRRMATDG